MMKRAEAEIERKNEELAAVAQQNPSVGSLQKQFLRVAGAMALILGPAETLLAAGGNLSKEQWRDIAVVQPVGRR